MTIIINVWQFIQDQLLKMVWLDKLVIKLLQLINIDTTNPLGGSIQFFIYDVIIILGSELI